MRGLCAIGETRVTPEHFTDHNHHKNRVRCYALMALITDTLFDANTKAAYLRRLDGCAGHDLALPFDTSHADSHDGTEVRATLSASALPPPVRAALLLELLRSARMPFLDVDNDVGTQLTRDEYQTFVQAVYRPGSASTTDLLKAKREMLLRGLRVAYLLASDFDTLREQSLNAWLTALLEPALRMPTGLTQPVDGRASRVYECAIHRERIRLAFFLVRSWAAMTRREPNTHATQSASQNGEDTPAVEMCKHLISGLSVVSRVLCRRLACVHFSQTDAVKAGNDFVPRELVPPLIVVSRSGSRGVGSGSIHSNLPYVAQGKELEPHWKPNWTYTVRCALEAVVCVDDGTVERMHASTIAQIKNATLLRSFGVQTNVRGGIGGFCLAPRKAGAGGAGGDDASDAVPEAVKKYAKSVSTQVVYWLAGLEYDVPNVLRSAINLPCSAGRPAECGMPASFKPVALRENVMLRMQTHAPNWRRVLLADLWSLLLAESQTRDWEGMRQLVQCGVEYYPYYGYPPRGASKELLDAFERTYSPYRAGEPRRTTAQTVHYDDRPRFDAHKNDSKYTMHTFLRNEVITAERQPASSQAVVHVGNCKRLLASWTSTRKQVFELAAHEAMRLQPGEPAEQHLVKNEPLRMLELSEDVRRKYGRCIREWLDDLQSAGAAATDNIQVRCDVALMTAWTFKSWCADGSHLPDLAGNITMHTVATDEMLVALCPKTLDASYRVLDTLHLGQRVMRVMAACGDGKLASGEASHSSALPRWLSGAVVDDIAAGRAIQGFRRGDDASVHRLLRLRHLLNMAVRLRSASAIDTILMAAELDKCSPYVMCEDLLLGDGVRETLLSPDLGLPWMAYEMLMISGHRGECLASYLVYDRATKRAPQLLPPRQAADVVMVSSTEASRAKRARAEVVDLTQDEPGPSGSSDEPGPSSSTGDEDVKVPAKAPASPPQRLRARRSARGSACRRARRGRLCAGPP